MPRAVLHSEREAWEAVLRYAEAIQYHARAKGSPGITEAAISIGAIAESMLDQLNDSIHTNPRLEYARALGARIRTALADTKHEALAHRVTHAMMTGRLDKVKVGEAEDLVKALEHGGHTHSAGQFATLWNRNG